MTATPLIGIVTVLFASDGVLPDFFASLARQEGIRYRLYIIDNSKTDSGSRLSEELARQHGVDAEIVFNDFNGGVAKGNNQGIERALRDNCDLVLLSNNDIVFEDPRLIANMVAFADERRVDAVVPKIYYFADKNRIWCAGGEFSMLRGTNPHYGEGEVDRGQFDVAKRIDYSPTCFMLMRSEMFTSVGMMDERYFVYYDDSDYLLRMKQAGKTLFYWPQGSLWHKVNYSTSGVGSDFGLFYTNRNRILFIRKNFGAVNKLVSLAFFFLTRLVKWFAFSSEQKIVVRKAIKEGWAIKP